MQIFDSKGTLVLDVEVDDTSYRYRAIMGDHNLTLKYALDQHTEIPVGAWCEYQNETYTLMRPEALTMKHTHNFEYTVTMESPQAFAKMWKFRNMVDGRLKFSYTAKPEEHLQMFVDNMNAREETLKTGNVWTVGECIENDEVCINYDHAYCYDALGQMADTFETEFEINRRVVSLKKLEYNKDNPLALSYGRGNGFQPSVGRKNYGDTPPIEILYVQGGTDNIDGSKYPKNVHAGLVNYSTYLLLPPDQEIGYDGEHFSDEEGYDPTDAHTYIVDTYGYSIRRADKEYESHAEDSLDCSEIYPKRVGTISEVIHDEKNDWWDIVDQENPVNYEDYLIEGETMTIIFQSGQLAGKEFEVKYVHTDRRFEIVPQEIDGYTMPCEAGGYYPQVGDTYAVFHCSLPNEYICDNGTKSGAEWDMLRKAVQYIYEHEEEQFTFSGKLDGIWSKKDWVNIGGRILLGGYVSFQDDRFQEEALPIRITGIKDYINKPHSPELELSNCIISAGFSTSLRQMESQNVMIEDRYDSALSFTKRRFRDAQETMEMLQALIDNFSTEFTSSIAPITVQTMQMLVGDESLQFAFTDETFENIVTHDFVYDQEAKQLKTDGGYAKHFTLGIDTIANIHSSAVTGDSYQHWTVNSYESAVLDDPDQAYYLYLQAETIAGEGSKAIAWFELSTEPLPLEDSHGYFYNLLVGILNSEYEGERSFVTLYGYTEILPGRITTDKIVSNNGKTYFDLAEGEIGGTIVFRNENNDMVTKIEGGIVTSGRLQVGFDGNNNSFAGMSAEGTADSSVRFWAGDTFNNRESAPFRVTQDGSLYSVKGEIAAFTLSQNGLTSKDTSAFINFEESTTDYMYLSANGIDFQSTYSSLAGGSGTVQTLISSNAEPTTSDNYITAMKVAIDRETSSYGNRGIYVDVKGSTVLDPTGTQGNNALYIESGCIAGLRLHTRRVVDSDATLSNIDGFIVVATNSDHSIYLPQGAEDGQMIVIKHIGSTSATITVYPQGEDEIGDSASSSGSKKLEMSSGEIRMFFYDSRYGMWHAGWLQSH